MASRILTASLFACLAGLAAVPASAQTSGQHCYRDRWSGEYRCAGQYESKYSTTYTYCAFGRRSGSRCQTERVEKPELRLPLEIPRPAYTPPPQGTVDPALYGGIPDSNDPAELRRQREIGKREEAAARR